MINTIWTNIFLKKGIFKIMRIILKILN